MELFFEMKDGERERERERERGISLDFFRRNNPT